MKYKLLILITTFSVMPMGFLHEVRATQNSDTYQPVINPKENSSVALNAAKRQQNADTLKRIDKRAKGRVLQNIGGKMVEITDDISDMLANAPLSIQQQNPTTVVVILNRLVTGVGLTLRALGRRKEALQTIMSSNEQILEAAAQSYEKIESLSTTIESLIGPKTVMDAVKQIQSTDLSKGQKILSLLSPSNYINTFNKFTDDLYITDNKAKRWEQIKKINKDLQEEQSRFDDYIALLQIKLLEKMIMALHIGENKDAYIVKLNESIKTLDAAIAITNSKIEALGANPGKGGVLNKLKKVVGKDQETKNAKDKAALFEEREKYMKQKDGVLEEIKHYQGMKVDPNSIKQERDDLIRRISEVRGRKVGKMTPEELKSEIQDLKAQIDMLRSDVDVLKKSKAAGPQALRLQPTPYQAKSRS